MGDFKELSRETLAKIKAFGLGRETIKRFKCSCRSLETFLQKHELEFTPESGKQWLSELKHGPNLYLSYRRTMLLLLDSQNEQLNEWKIYPITKPARPETEHYGTLLELYRQYLILEGLAQSTITCAMMTVSMFFRYLENHGVNHINDLTTINISDFWGQDVFSGRRPNGIREYANKIRRLLIFLEERDFVRKHLHLAIPRVFAKQVSIVTTLSPKAEQHLISVDKLSEPLGKRDQAMILLALRLGIRRSDIVNLKLSDINWQNDTITFVQQKTKVPITLPLLTDVGNALMDYIIDSRGDADADEIFLRSHAPHRALNPVVTNDIARKYLSGFGPDDCSQKGFHILRRTVATKLFENNVPSSVISASLGHLNPNSSEAYLSTDAQMMRKCALSLSGIECTMKELL